MLVVAAVDAVSGVTGQKAVAAAGTAEQMTSDARKLSVGVKIKALADNSGNIYWGFSNAVDSTNGYELVPGESDFIEIKDGSVIWIDASQNGDAVCFVLL